MLLLLLLISYTTATQVIKLRDANTHQGLINATSTVLVTFKGLYPFELYLYTREGIVLHYKSDKVSYKGKVSYYEIIPMSEAKNRIEFIIRKVEIDYIKIVYSAVALTCLIALILLKRDHVLSQTLLVATMLFKLYIGGYDTNNSEWMTRVANDIVRKVLF